MLFEFVCFCVGFCVCVMCVMLIVCDFVDGFMMCVYLCVWCKCVVYDVESVDVDV